MAGRVYVCPLVTVTTIDPDGGGDVVEVFPLVATLGATEFTACVASDPATGAVLYPWTLVWCDARDWAAIDANTDCTLMTDVALDGPVPTTTKNKLVKNGVVTNAEMSSVTTVRRLLDLLVSKHYPYATMAEAFPKLET